MQNEEPQLTLLDTRDDVYGGCRHGGAAAAYPAEVGQKWKRRMEVLNLRAARQAFRERNPDIRVGVARDGRSVLDVRLLCS